MQIKLSLGKYKQEGHFSAVDFMTANAYWLLNIVSRLNQDTVLVVLDESTDIDIPCYLARNVKLSQVNKQVNKFAIALNAKLLSSLQFSEEHSLKIIIWLWLNLFHTIRHFIQESHSISRDSWIFWQHLDFACEMDKGLGRYLSQKLKVSVGKCCESIPMCLDAMVISMVATNMLISHELEDRLDVGLGLDVQLSKLLLATGSEFVQHQADWALIAVEDEEN